MSTGCVRELRTNGKLGCRPKLSNLWWWRFKRPGDQYDEFSVDLCGKCDDFLNEICGLYLYGARASMTALGENGGS